MNILAINPGSTSTKIAVYEDEKLVFSYTIRHSVEELSVFKNVIHQYELRKKIILDVLKENNILLSFDAVIGRGGIVKPIPSGVYEVNEALLTDLKNSPRAHASNLGGLLAHDLASTFTGCKAFIADPVVVDELEDIARVTGSPLLPRVSIFHALNHKAVARRYAREHNAEYDELNLIVCHLGGGISVGVHRKGKVIDVNNALDGEGPFSPERAGTLPAAQLVELCFSGDYPKEELLKLITGKAGLTAHLGTTDTIAILNKIKEGDSKCKLILDAMIYNVAKAVGSAAAVLRGQIDAIIVTGGIAHSEYVITGLKEYISFLAPITVYPGEDEMEALAANAREVLQGTLPLKEYR